MKAFFSKLRLWGKWIGIVSASAATLTLLISMLWTSNVAIKNESDISRIDEHQRDTDELITDYRLEVERLRGEIAIIRHQNKVLGRWVNEYGRTER